MGQSVSLSGGAGLAESFCLCLFYMQQCVTYVNHLCALMPGRLHACSLHAHVCVCVCVWVWKHVFGIGPLKLCACTYVCVCVVSVISGLRQSGKTFPW